MVFFSGKWPPWVRKTCSDNSLCFFFLYFSKCLEIWFHFLYSRLKKIVERWYLDKKKVREMDVTGIAINKANIE